MERAVQRLMYVFVLLFLALVFQLTYVQIYAAPDLKTNAANTRSLEAEMRVERGLIISADGTVLAENRQEGDYFFRRYPLGELMSPWIGYNSLRYGRSGVERVYNEELAGETDEQTVRSFLDDLLGRPQRGADLHLTIDTRVQRAASDALGSRRGAVVAIDPRTGAIIAMASWPRFDPNAVDERWEHINEDPGRPLLNRALQGLYPPGSSFKPVVAAAGLAENVVRPDTPFEDDGEYLVGGYRVRNYDGNSYGAHDFSDAMIRSINTTFAKVGVELGGTALQGYAEEFGWNREIPLDLEVAESVFPEASDMDEAHVAQVSFGQGELLATPLQMALVAGGVANGGRIMEPYVVQEVRSYSQAVLRRADPSVWSTPVSAAVADQVAEMMVGVVQSGTGTAAAIPGVTVGGKTGTAEVAEGGDHAWFIGFAPAENPSVAVAVIVENAGTGGAVAAPIARSTMQAALER